VPGEPNVSITGDLAAFEHEGGFLPMVAQVAMQQGEAGEVPGVLERGP
jgi:NADH dehydrogenase FAD-containing subunit